ncbi:Hint domain-containing protein [Anianabacter salinae]|uniref:Hint domain-containing protein n=1 Tax=Anianabacter salinae TaxID=2851023 RepID=UPI00225E5468|nr:Hint domain-containing protein [Anianabacter salinae]MBV0914223.1 Hint domain-containing protein [Anianabacter salinae]
MPTTFNWIFLGTAVELDGPDETDFVVENAGAIVGDTYGSVGDPLYGRIASATMIDNGGAPNFLDTRNSVSNDEFTTDIGSGVQTFIFDVSIQYNATITYVNGTTTTVTAVLAQSTTGELFLAPEFALNADVTAYEAFPIVSITLDSLLSAGSGLTTDRQAQAWDDGVITGTGGDDLIDASYVEPISEGSDRVDNGDGLTGAGFNDDVINAGAGNDTVLAGAGDDTVLGGDGNDYISGGDGNDSLSGGIGNDTIDGGNSNDTIDGGNDNDTIDAGDGNDVIVASQGSDTVSGGAGTDTLQANQVITGSLDVTVDNTGSGTAVQDGVGTATLTSVESFIANEFVGETDSITITDTVVDGAKVDPTGTLFDVADVSGLDDNAVGTFTPANGDPVLNFGPLPEAQQLSDILALGLSGQIQITDGDESGTVGGISFSNFEEINFGITCFVRGTLIRTRRGEIRIEDLAVGDDVLTADAGEQPIRWIGSRKLGAREMQLNPKLRPIRIRANALAPGLPEHDLSVSPQHRVLVRSVIAERMFGSREVLIPANKLLVLPGIEIDDSAAEVEYFHMLFDAHQIVWSNGALTESLFTGPEALKGLSVEARTEITLLFPAIVEPRFLPEPARLIPQKGKQMKVLAARIAKHGKAVTEMRLSG